MPPPFGSGSPLPFPTVVSIADVEHQMFLAWHELEHTLKRKNVRQVNRVRIYASQMAGAVR